MCVAVCVCWGEGCVCTCARACLGGVCDLPREKAAPSWAPSCNNWFHSFMPSLLTSISSVSARLVPGPALRAGASLGPGTHPLLPWRNSQSREETDQEKQKAIPSRKWIWWKRHWIWQERCRWELCSQPCDRAATAEILGPAGTVHFGMGGWRERRGVVFRRLWGPEGARGAHGAYGRQRRCGLQDAMAEQDGGQGCPARAGVAGGAPTLQRARGLAPPAGGGLARLWRVARLPLPSPPGERVRGGADSQSRRCRAECGAGLARGRGRGAWLRSALQCGGGNRFQFVLLLAQRALLAPGTKHSLSRLEGLLAGLRARCRETTPQASGDTGLHNPTAGVSWSLTSSGFTIAEVASTSSSS